MSRKYPFHGQQGEPLGARAQRRAAKKRRSDVELGFPREALPLGLKLPMEPFEAKLKRVIYAFYDSLDERAEFLSELQRYIWNYISSTLRPLPEMELGLTGIDLPQLEQICEEECCDTELFVQCHFLEIYKICPADIVVASGTESQKLLQELKKQAHDQPDGGARFLTLAEVLESTGRKGDLRDLPDRMAYFAAITERLYA